VLTHAHRLHSPPVCTCTRSDTARAHTPVHAHAIARTLGWTGRAHPTQSRACLWDPLARIGQPCEGALLHTCAGTAQGGAIGQQAGGPSPPAGPPSPMPLPRFRTASARSYTAPPCFMIRHAIRTRSHRETAAFIRAVGRARECGSDLRMLLQAREGRPEPDRSLTNKAGQTALALARTLPRKDILMLLSSDAVPSEQRHPNNS
jgi:hypothetical protein